MKVLKWLDENLEEVILILLLIAMVCIMGIQVVARYCFNQSLSWSEELTQYLFVWTTFISVSYCVKKRISIKIEQLLNILPEPGQTALRLFRHTVVFIFCIIMLPYCLRYLQQSIELEATSAALGIPMYYIQSAPLAGFLLLTIRVAQAWWREAKKMKGVFTKS
ncbi:MAG: TRAP transporter small permease [Lachnospiraceae bacterium]|nr:TRAP transporter small permease [Lachnospiraceae bacterium]